MRGRTAWTLAAVALAACSSGSSGGGNGGGDAGGGSAVSAQQAASDVASALCARTQACAPAFLTYSFGDESTCASRFTTAILTSIGANGSGTSPAAAESCAQALQQASCADVLSRDLPAACHKAGTLADGAACAADSQCQNLRCAVAPGQSCGTCTSLAKAGGSCKLPDDCEYGTDCVAGTCTAFGKQGDACSATKPCRADLACRSGTCGAPALAGEACMSSAECDAVHAVDCNPATQKCAPLQFAQAGAACGVVAGQIVACKGPADCTGITQNNPQGTCRAFASDGAACDPTNGPFCVFPAVCTGGKCAFADATTCH